MSSVALTFYPTDQDFVKNVNELAQSHRLVKFSNIVRNGKANHSDYAPQIRHDGYIEYNGWRHPIEEITKVVIYI